MTLRRPNDGKHSDEIRATMESIERKLRAHNDKRREHYGSWDYVGDVTEVLARLREISAFMGADR